MLKKGNILIKRNDFGEKITISKFLLECVRNFVEGEIFLDTSELHLIRRKHWNNSTPKEYPLHSFSSFVILFGKYK